VFYVCINSIVLRATLHVHMHVHSAHREELEYFVLLTSNIFRPQSALDVLITIFIDYLVGLGSDF